MRTMVEILRYRAKYQGDSKAYTFLRDGDKDEITYTYRLLDIRARAIASMLQSKVNQGDRVMLFYHQGLDFMTAFYGCLYAGVIAVPGYPPEKYHRRLTRMQAIIEDAEAKLALSTTDVLASLEIEEGNLFNEFRMPWFATDTLSDCKADDWIEPLIDRDTVTYLQYSSGSTGNPKGIMVSHGNMLDNSAIICERLQHTSADVNVSWLPIFHDLGLVGCVIQPMFVGFHAVSLSPFQFVQKPFLWLQAIHRYRGTTTCCPNFGFDLCVRKITVEERKTLDLRSWRIAVNCAEPVRIQTLDRFTDTFAPYGFNAKAHYPMYGMAETTLYITGGVAKYQKIDNRSFDLGKIARTDESSQDAMPVVSCGTAGDGIEVRLIDPEFLTPSEPNTVGEIWVKGSSVAHGYWNREQQTKEDFHAYIGEEGPFLRTGDLGFFIDSELYIAGRIKDLIIIRGRNIYPQDIEHTVEMCSDFVRPGCGAAFSVDIEDEERLVVVQEVRNQVSRAELADLANKVHQAIIDEHGVACYELVFVAENSAIKTSSGKIQRKASKEAYLMNHLHVIYQSVENNKAVDGNFSLELAPYEMGVFEDKKLLEKKLVQMIGVSKTENIGSQSLTFLGFDSLKILQLKFLLESKFQIKLPKMFVFLSWTWDQLIYEVYAQLMNKKDSNKQISKQTKNRKFPLNRGQEALWYIAKAYPENTAYHVPVALHFPKELDVTLFTQSLQRVFDRHAILRTTIQTDKHGKPIHVVNPEGSISLQIREALVDFSEQLVDNAFQPFSLENGPLFRVTLFTHLDGTYTCLFCFHHIICDLWTLDLFLSEWRTIYEKMVNEDSSALPELIQFVDVMKADEFKLDKMSYWRKELSGDLPILNLPHAHIRGNKQSFRGSKVQSWLSASLFKQIRSFASKQHATPYQVLFATYQVLLARYTGQEDILVGTPTVGREYAAEAEVMGYMVNPVVIRANLAGELTFKQLLSQVSMKIKDALHHQVPFIDIVEQLAPNRDTSIPAIFQAMIVFEQSSKLAETAALSLGIEDVKISWGDWDAVSIAIPDQSSQFDLTLKIAEYKGKLAMVWQYDSALFQHEQIEQLAENFEFLLEQILDEADCSIQTYSILTEQQKSKLLSLGRGDQLSIPDHTLASWWISQAMKTPHKVAIIDGSTQISYQTLMQQVNQLAHCLQSKGIGAGHIVAIGLERDARLIVAVLAVLQTGAAYLGLDFTYPKERLFYILQDADASLLITTEELSSYEFSIPTLLFDWNLLTNNPTTNVLNQVTSTDLAYLIYTSGSTGNPKGVAIEHSQAVSFIRWAHENFSPDELKGVLFSTSICFDLSIFELFVPLLCGGTVIIAENALSLASIPAIHDVTLVNTVPSAAKEFVRFGIPSSVRTINLAGEPLSYQLSSALYSLGSIQKVYNLYGPSECTTYSTFALVQRDLQTNPPIGRPIANTDIYVLDGHGSQLPYGVTGELYIGGAGVARGYLQKPDQTAQKFIEHPRFGRLYRTGDLVRLHSDGQLTYHGRTDFQVKVRGYRIELGELETVLLQHSGVAETVAVYENEKLIAYVVPNNQASSPQEWRAYLETKLPKYMIPAWFVPLSRLPLTPNGKIDRKALPKPKIENDSLLTPRNWVEQQLFEIWCQVLKLEEIGLQDRFFEIGGDSILSLQVIAEAKAAHLHIHPTHFFSHPTIELMAQIVTKQSNSSACQEIIKGETVLTPIQQWFFSQEISNFDNWNQSMIIQLTRKIDPKLLTKALQYLVEHHDALRLRFERKQEDWTSRYAEKEVNQVLHVVQGDDLPLEQIHQEAEGRLHLKDGPLITATYVEYSTMSPKLILVVHHLAVDGVSWRILLADLVQLYKQYALGKRIQLAPKSTSYHEWAHSLYNRMGLIGHKGSEWVNDSAQKHYSFPIDFPDGINMDSQLDQFAQVFTEQETSILLRIAPSEHRAKTHEILLASLWQAYQEWSGSMDMQVDIEGHGRESIDGEVDLTRTVGWFTSIYPLFLQADPKMHVLKVVQEAWQQVKLGGIDFGILRYLAKDPSLQHMQTSPICFNYLGQMDQMRNEWIKELSFFGPRRNQEARHSYLIELNCYVMEDRFICNWLYSQAIFNAKTIERFAEAFARQCRKYILSKPVINSSIDQEDIQRIFSQIKERKGR